jgi:RNA polymerase sigma-70 factor (ECF subfamily)
MVDTRVQTLRVLRAQAGDRPALDGLLRSVQAPLYRYIRSLIGDPALAEDVLQDVFLLIYRKLRHLRDPALFRPWAYRIASRRALRVLERERKRSGYSLDDLGTEPLAAPPQFESSLIASLLPLLTAISPASRAVLSLHYLEDLSLQETADVLGIPIGTAKSRLGYGLEAMRRLLASPGFDGRTYGRPLAHSRPVNTETKPSGGRHE